MSTPAPNQARGTVHGLRDNADYLASELRRLDGLLRRQVARLRQGWRARPAITDQHLYIGHEEIDWLLDCGPAPADVVADAPAAEIPPWPGELAAPIAACQRRGVFLGLPALAQRLGLANFETLAVLVCLAPELRRHYDRVYAYLQDDITRKRPSVELILDLLCRTEAGRWQARALLCPGAPLLRLGVLQPVEDPASPSGASGLAQFLRLDSRILQFVLGQPGIDAQLDELVSLRQANPTSRQAMADCPEATALAGFLGRHFSVDSPPGRRIIIHLQGPAGAGKQHLALALGETLGVPLLCIDARTLPVREDELEHHLRRLCRESLLLQTPLFMAAADSFLGDGDDAHRRRGILSRTLGLGAWLVFLGGEHPWPHRELFEDALFHVATLKRPDMARREFLWRETLASLPPPGVDGDPAADLAMRFQLTPGQIRNAADEVADRLAIHDRRQALPAESVARACRGQLHHRLAELATSVKPRYQWRDLILPESRLTALRELCAQRRHQQRVYHHWGFAERLAHGRGLSALFSGPPGTGKTMAAEVIASALGLELYKIDLAGVVSKYIGETEKNLARIFDEAEHSSAVLFFDEADALFGKRTEVSDAHDRYANIETSYLLQKMDDYQGMVILASNLRENMDSAFLRRLRFVVEFPFPDAAHRLEIWRTHLPPRAPLAGDLDLPLLAERLPVAGGNIRNIILNAAFLAADQDGPMGMAHFLAAARREFEKIGKLWDEQALTRKR